MKAVNLISEEIQYFGKGQAFPKYPQTPALKIE
jgi:hypothetical protein